MNKLFNLLLQSFKKRIILITFYDLGLGGIQTGLVDLANELDKKKDAKVVVFLKSRKKFEKTSSLSDSITVIYTPVFLPSIIRARYYYLLILLIITIRPYSVFVSLEETSLFVIKWLKRLKIKSKIIVSANNLMSEEGKKNFEEVGRIFNKADKVIAVSKSTYNDLRNKYKLRKPTLVYAPNWTTQKSNHIKLFSQRKDDIIFLGRFDEQKQPQLVVDFAGMIREKGINRKISMYGSGKLKKTLEHQIRRLGLDNIVSIMPVTKNAYSKLLNSKFVILTSKYEGLPFVLLEAMSAGCVILSLEAPGVSEIVIDAKTGICKKNVKLIAKEYIDLIREENQHKYHRLQRLALKYQKNNYSTKNLEKVVEIVYS